jgi:hypothetical protein
VNRPINPTAAEEGFVGCVDNGIDCLMGDVALDDLKPAAKPGRCAAHGRDSFPAWSG